MNYLLLGNRKDFVAFRHAFQPHAKNTCDPVSVDRDALVRQLQRRLDGFAAVGNAEKQGDASVVRQTDTLFQKREVVATREALAITYKLPDDNRFC